MPLNRDPKHGGTNADGSKSREYCSYCYQQGTWMMSMTLDDMQRRVGGLLKSKGAPDSIVTQAISGLPRLKRWKG